MTRKKMTILVLQEKKARGEPITMITAYDYPGALAADRTGMALNAVQRPRGSSARVPAAMRSKGAGRGKPEIADY